MSKNNENNSGCVDALLIIGMIVLITLILFTIFDDHEKRLKKLEAWKTQMEENYATNSPTRP